MAQCLKCNAYLPPGFVLNEDPLSGNKLPCPQCLFCIKDTKTITYGDGKQVTKRDLVKEYKEFLQKVKENNELLKVGVKGNIIIPGAEKFLI